MVRSRACYSTHPTPAQYIHAQKASGRSPHAVIPARIRSSSAASTQPSSSIGAITAGLVYSKSMYWASWRVSANVP